MKKDNKSYVTLSVVSSFKRIGTRNEIKSFFDKIKEIIKTEEKIEEEFSILLTHHLFYSFSLYLHQLHTFLSSLLLVDIIQLLFP